MHSVGHCAVWLVLLDPERSIHHAKAPAPQEGPGRCELDHREPPRSRTFQLAPWGRLGPQPVSGERGTESAIRVQTHRQSHPRLGADKDTISNFTRSFPLLWHLLPPPCRVSPGWMTSLLSLPPQLYLGMYPDEHFIEKPVKEAMEKFRKQLAEVTSSIKRRNDGKRLPYYNMSPDKIPNSVAVWGGGDPTLYFASPADITVRKVL